MDGWINLKRNAEGVEKWSGIRIWDRITTKS